jgi:hypothetical protein
MKDLWRVILKDMQRDPTCKTWTAEILDWSVGTLDAMARAGYVKCVNGTAYYQGRRRGNWWMLTEKGKAQEVAP